MYRPDNLIMHEVIVSPLSQPKNPCGHQQYWNMLLKTPLSLLLKIVSRRCALFVLWEFCVHTTRSVVKWSWLPWVLCLWIQELGSVWVGLQSIMVLLSTQWYANVVPGVREIPGRMLSVCPPGMWTQGKEMHSMDSINSKIASWRQEHIIWLNWRMGRSVQRPCIRLKAWKFSYHSPVAISGVHVYCFFDRLQQGARNCKMSCFPVLSYSEKPKGKFFFSSSGNAPEVSLLGCETAGSHYIIVQHSQVILPLLHYKWCPGSFLLFLSSYSSFVKSIQVFVHVCIRAKNSSRGKVFKFNLLCGGPMPWPSLPFLHHYAILMEETLRPTHINNTCWLEFVLHVMNDVLQAVLYLQEPNLVVHVEFSTRF